MKKTSALRIRIDPELHKTFLSMCKAQDIPAAQVIRGLMSNYVEKNKHAVQPDFFLDENYSCQSKDYFRSK